MTADILTLDDFQRDDAGQIPTSQYEHYSHPFWQSPFVALPDAHTHGQRHG